MPPGTAPECPGALPTWPGLGHGVKPVLDEALDRVAAFLREVMPAEPGSA
jgi:hypothetical protein